VETLSGDGDGGSLADVISNLLTGPVYEWIRARGGDRIRGKGGLIRETAILSARSKPRGGLDLRLTLLEFVLWTANRLTVQKGELSSGAYTKSFFQYTSPSTFLFPRRFTLSTLPPCRR